MLELLFLPTCMLEILVRTEVSFRFVLKNNRSFIYTEDFVSEQFSLPGAIMISDLMAY